MNIFDSKKIFRSCHGGFSLVLLFFFFFIWNSEIVVGVLFGCIERNFDLTRFGTNLSSRVKDSDRF